MSAAVCEGVCLLCMCFIFQVVCVPWQCVSGWKAFDVQLCVGNTAACGRRLVNGAVTSRVTSLITSVTFSQMSFLCD